MAENEIDDKIKKIIEENPVAFATVSEERPYVIAVAFVKVKDKKIIITNNYMQKTIGNIRANKNVSLACWDKEWRGYQINGEAEYFEEGEWLEFVKSIKDNRDEPCKGAIVITIKEVKRLA